MPKYARFVAMMRCGDAGVDNADVGVDFDDAADESEDDDDPRTPTSVSSQGSQGYDSAGSDFVDVEGFTAIPDSSLPELNLQV